MIKNIAGLIIIASLITGTYFIGVNNSASDNEKNASKAILNTANQPGTLTQSELFSKKVECEKYTKKITDDLRQDQYALEALYQIFYSPIKNTCLSAKYILYPSHGTVEESETLRIDDILTGENVWVQNYKPQMKFWDAEGLLDEQMAKLK